MKTWMTVDRRLQFGHFDQLLSELRLEDSTSFANFVRLPVEIFDELLHRIQPYIEKQVTTYRVPISPGVRLAATLRHLATGEGYNSLLYNFRVSKSSLCHIVPEVCQAIVSVLKDEVFSFPRTPEEWRPIADEFRQRWNVPHACGALDGKHVRIRKPDNTGSEYHNYKGYFSIVLMALVDAQYRFIWIDTGGNGSMSDSQIFNASQLSELLSTDTLGLPAAEPLPNSDTVMPFYMLGDDAFALRKTMMKPYGIRNLDREQRIANYRISRGRRVVENAFGILTARNQILLKSIMQRPEVVRDMIEAMVCIHNLLRQRNPVMNVALVDGEDDEHNIIPGEWRNLRPLDGGMPARGHRARMEGQQQREALKDYFNSPAGAVSWQDRMI